MSVTRRFPGGTGLALAAPLAVAGCVHAQELTLNPGLESCSRCPIGID